MLGKTYYPRDVPGVDQNLMAQQSSVERNKVRMLPQALERLQPLRIVLCPNGYTNVDRHLLFSARPGVYRGFAARRAGIGQVISNSIVCLRSIFAHENRESRRS